MGITATLSSPYYTGSTSSAEVPSRYDVALNGRPYMLDMWASIYTNHTEFMHESVPLIRNQADQSSSPSEASINPEDLWRRSQDTWHKGSGQAFLDRADSDAARFDTSKGVNVWTRWQLSLLPDTGQKLVSTNTNLALVAVGSYLYCADGQVLRRTADVTAGSPTWTVITGTHASTIQSICSDGYTVYLANSGGVYTTTRGGAAMTGAPYNALVCTLLRYVKGRLMAANANVVYNITAGGAAPAALYTHPNTDFVWTDFAEGQTVFYGAGYSGDKSLVYKFTIKADGTALDIPTVAGELPDGEIVRSLQGYLGFLLVGTDKGVRFAAQDSNGNLTIGALIPTGSAVKCFEPQDKYVWYGATNYDATSTGLGRMDLSTLTAALTPAYASDLMVTGQGTVLSVVTFQNIRVLAVSGLGVYAELTALVGSGTLDSGQITYRLPDQKVGMFVDVRHDGIGSHLVSVSVDGGAFAALGTAHTTEITAFAVGQQRGSRFDVRLTLTAVAGVSPVIRSYTLRAYATASTVRRITAPLLLHETLQLHNDNSAACNPSLELAQIAALRSTRSLVTWQEGNTTFPVVVEDFQWRPHHLTKDYKSWNGTCLIQMKAITS
jgi:hypothetical protein